MVQFVAAVYARVLMNDRRRTGVDSSILIAVRVARQGRRPEGAARIDYIFAPLGVVLGTGVVTGSVVGDRAFFRNLGAVEPGEAVVGADQHHGQREPIARSCLDLECEFVRETTDRGAFAGDRTVDIEHVRNSLGTRFSGMRRARVAVFGTRLDPGRGRVSD